MNRFHHFLVPTDFTPGAAQALSVALALAEPIAARVTLVHVLHVPAPATRPHPRTLSWPVEIDLASERELAGILAGAKKRYPAVQCILTGGDPREVIPKTANDAGADIIVMGTHGRRGLARALLGSVTERVVRTAQVPVLTVGPG